MANNKDQSPIHLFAKELNARFGMGFCLAKWRHLTLYLHLGEGHSCYHPQPHKIPLRELSKSSAALHNTRHKIEQRKIMKNGDRPEECSYCWNIEDLKKGNLSDRHIKSFEESGGHIEEVSKVFAADPRQPVNPSYIEVSFSSLCNFKCIYCNPKVSSSWEAEIKKFGPYEGIHNSYKIEKKVNPEDNPYVQAFFDWWPDVSSDLKGLRITGGEPLLHKSLEDFFGRLLKAASPDLTLMINSNLGVPNRRVKDFCKTIRQIEKSKSVKSFKLFTSLESIGKRAEFTRSGLDFSLFKKNVKTYLDETSTDLSFMCTYNLTSATAYTEFLDYFYSLRKEYCQTRRRIFLDIPYLEYPRMFHFSLLGSENIKYADQAVAFIEARVGREPFAFDQNELALMTRIRDLWKKGPLGPWEYNHYRADLARFLAQVEKRRNVNFCETFPELKNFYKQIAQEANL